MNGFRDNLRSMFNEYYSSEDVDSWNQKLLKTKTEEFFMNQIFYITIDFYKENEVVLF